jgi:hypothetical protein
MIGSSLKLLIQPHCLAPNQLTTHKTKQHVKQLGSMIMRSFIFNAFLIFVANGKRTLPRIQV